MKNFKSNLKSGFHKIGASVKNNFLFATASFIFIVFFIQAFQKVFGLENSIIGIIITILMGITAGKDVAAAPVKSVVTTFCLFGGMCVAACFSVALGAWIAIPINLLTTFLIIYAYTYEYSNHLYFPYLLSYLFLLYISPVSVAALPKRLLAVAAGSIVMVLYALVLHRRNIRKPEREAFDKLFDAAEATVNALGGALPDNREEVRKQVRVLSKNMENRKKSILNTGGKHVASLDVACTLENLILFLGAPEWGEEGFPAELKASLANTLAGFRDFHTGKIAGLANIPSEDYDKDERTRYLYCLLSFIRLKLLESQKNRPEKHERGEAKSTVPFGARLKMALDYSPVRLVYAIRTALLLTLFIIPVQYFNLTHGKWLLFTLASVSLPYAEDVVQKGAKRMGATLIGGTLVFLCFSLIPNAAARTAIMMLSGYVSFYFKDYFGNYACATVGALGGAVLTNASGFVQVGSMFAIRLAYIAAGIVLAFIANLVICPYHRKKASENIFRRYELTSQYLADLKIETLDLQLYHHIVVENNLLEEKLLENASKHNDEATIVGVHSFIKAKRKSILKSQGNLLRENLN